MDMWSRRSFGVFLTALAAQASFAAAAQSSRELLAGRSLHIRFTETRTLEDVGTGDHKTTDTMMTSLTVYVGKGGNVFEHVERQILKGRGGPEAHQAKAVAGQGGAWKIEGNSLVKMFRMQEGVRRYTINLSGNSCSFDVRNLRENGSGEVVWKNAFAPGYRKLLSSELTGSTCEVHEGNSLDRHS